LKNKLNKRNLVVIAVITLVIAIVLSSFVFLNYQNSYQGKVESIVYGDSITGSSALIYVAQNQKFFAENGIDFSIQKYTSGPNAINATKNSEVDVGYSSEFAFVGSSALKNENLSIIATVAKVEGYFLIARKDLGIQNPSDLAGKRVGVAIGTITQFYLGRFLELNNVESKTVTLVNMPFSQTVDALENGTVDAVVSFSPYSDQIQSQLAGNVVTWSAQSSQEGYGLIFCRDSWITQHPDLVVRFLKSLKQAEDYLVNNPTAAKSIFQKTLNRTEAETATVFSQVSFSLSLDQSLLLEMQDEAQWLISNNLTNATAIPNFLNYIYLDGLESAKTNSVTVIH
jgi:NitT/TauT family transport system substrate-binding protein